jgi:glutaredoxin
MELIVYSAPWCSDCRQAKHWLAEHKIPYQDINIEAVPGAAEEIIKRTGMRTIPQFVVNGEWIQPYVPGKGFNHEKMALLFGVTD